MKISILINDTALKNLKSQHGLSIFVETEDKNILFDTGSSDFFYQNAENMGLNLKKTDLCIISHGHDDHGGGLGCFLENIPGVPVYIQKNAFKPHFSESRYNGLDIKLKDNKNIVFTDNVINIGENIILFSDVNTKNLLSESNNTLFMEKNGVRVKDDFSHEQNMIIRENEKEVLFTGYAHKGIVNIVERAKTLLGHYPSHIVGGFHLSSNSHNTCEKTVLINQISEYLLQTGSMCHTLHCTGTKGYEILKNKMKNKVEYLPCGSIIYI